MRSQTTASFWVEYQSLPENINKGARKAYRLWLQNPFHPSLHFKCINFKGHIWSLRISLGYRALGIYESDTVIWFWVIHHMRSFSHSPHSVVFVSKKGITANSPSSPPSEKYLICSRPYIITFKMERLGLEPGSRCDLPVELPPRIFPVM